MKKICRKKIQRKNKKIKRTVKIEKFNRRKGESTKDENE